MSPEATAVLLFEYLKNVIYDPAEAQLDVDLLPDEFKDLGKGLLYFGQSVIEASALARAISKGELNANPLSPGNELAANLKALQATLKHLTWQIKQVAKGDYHQRVSFMGEFSDSINDMIHQLDERSKALLAEVEANKQKTQALLQSNSLFEAITDNISQWIVMLDKESHELLFSNHPITDVVVHTFGEEATKAWFDEQIERSNANLETGVHSAELKLEMPNAVQYFSVTIYSINWHEHDALAFVLTDITDEKKRFHRLETIAFKDSLTAAYNRHYGMTVLDEWLAEGLTFCICFVDMDNLKYVNDKFGHAEGDNYINRVVESLKKFDAKTIVCRLGGDEFMLLCKGYTQEVAERRLEALRSELTLVESDADAVYHRSLSYGVIEVKPDETRTASDLLAHADEKMYAYKYAHKMERRNNA
jgi:diguanylate cyclase (GGDEF)-like protein